MSELPTATEPPTTPDVARTLADIEADKLGASPDVAECLTAISDLVRITGTPKTLDWVIGFLGREELRVYAAQHHLTLHESRAAGEEQLDRAVIIWTAGAEGLALVPTGQRPAATLLQLREEIAQRDEELTQAANFQASVAAGYVEGVEAWAARTSKAGEVNNAPVRARDTPGRVPTPQKIDGLLVIDAHNVRARYECYRPGCTTPLEVPVKPSAITAFIDGIKARHLRQYHGENR